MNPFRQEADSQLDGMSGVNPWEGTQKPRFWAGTGFNESTDYAGPLDVLARGAASGASKGAAVLTGLWGREYDVLGRIGEALHIPGASSSRDEAQYLQGLSETATENAKKVLPDAATTGTAANILAGLGSGAELFLAGGGGMGGAVSVGSGEGTARTRELASAGVSEPVSAAAGAVTGVTSALGALMPGGFGSGLVKRILTGAASNTAFGMASRYADHLILEKGGYQEMADQQKVWDAGSMLADAVLGGGFGALSHLHAEPSQDAARTLNVANADRQSAPGVPADATAANAHQAALEKATTDMQQGKPVDVGTTNVREADFAARPAPEITEPMGWLADSLKHAGISEAEQELHRLDETLFQKTGERMIEPTEGTQRTPDAREARDATKSLESTESAQTEAKPSADPVTQALQERPDLEIPNEKGTAEAASETLTRADDEVSTGSKELPAATQAALNCFSRRS